MLSKRSNADCRFFFNKINDLLRLTRCIKTRANNSILMLWKIYNSKKRCEQVGIFIQEAMVINRWKRLIGIVGLITTWFVFLGVPAAAGWVEVIPMVVVNRFFSAHSQSHQSGHDDNENNESNVQVSFVFVFAACSQNRHEFISRVANGSTTGTD